MGIAPIDRFREGPGQTRPDYYMPDAQSVVSVGIAYPVGICDVWGEYGEEGKTVAPYMWFGYAYLNWELSHVALRVAKLLEAKGHRALPLPPTNPIIYRYFEKSDADLRFLADFSHRHAAVAAGLGEFGWNTLLVSPTHGAKQRLVSVITNAPLAPDSLYDGPQICDPRRCAYKCVEMCPVKAMSKTERVACRIDGRTYEYAKLDHMRCRWCLDGLFKGSGSRTHIEPPAKIFQRDLFEAGRRRELADVSCYALTHIDFCGRCMHSCPAPNYET
ncbi:MAG: hypothetical protein ACE5GD_02665 [Candidatus Geothermarchaeales archaeon]